MYRIAYTTRALKQLQGIQRQESKKLRDTINRKLIDPFNASGVKKLASSDYEFRLRVGKYRVFYNVDKVAVITRIEEVVRRQSKTY
jgi:mRNA interferase RelE/StbE